MAVKLLTPQKIVNLASDPAEGNAGQLYYNTTSNVLKYHDGTSWQTFSGGGGGGASTLNDLTDVTITSIQDDQIIAYDSATQIWKNVDATSVLATELDGGEPSSVAGVSYDGGDP